MLARAPVAYENVDIGNLGRVVFRASSSRPTYVRVGIPLDGGALRITGDPENK